MGKINRIGDGKYTNRISSNTPKGLTVSELTTFSDDELAKHGYKRYTMEEFMESDVLDDKELTPTQELKWYGFIRKMEEMIDEYRNR